MFRANRIRLQNLRTPYAFVSCRSCLSASCRARPSLRQSAAVINDRAYSDDAKAQAGPDVETPVEKAPVSPVADIPASPDDATTGKRSNEKGTKKKKKRPATPPRPRSPRRPLKKPSPSPKSAPIAARESNPEGEGPLGAEVVKRVFESLKNLEKSYLSINTKLTGLQASSQNPVNTQADESGDAASPGEKQQAKLDAGLRRQTQKLGGRLKTVSGTLHVLKNVLNSQQIPLDNLAKRQGTTDLPTTNATSSGKSQKSSSPQRVEATTAETKPPVKKPKETPKSSVAKETLSEAIAALEAKKLKLETSQSETWTTLAGRFRLAGGVSPVVTQLVTSMDSTDVNYNLSVKPRTSKSERARATKTPLDVQHVQARGLQLVPVELTDSPEIPRLSYGLHRALFNPGVCHLQDPHSGVFNFDPYLANIMPINEFDFNALKKYVTSSEDSALIALAAKLGKKYSGSTSSMTQLLAHFHFLLSAWRPVNDDYMTKKFNPEFSTFTQILRAPAAAFLHLRDGVYAIDADKEYDSASILSMLGKSMEKLLTLPKDEFEKYRHVNSEQISEEERNADEAFHFTTMDDLLMRSQLDAHDPRLPGTGMFDLKTRAVVSIRMDARGFQKGLGYEIRHRFGQWESFEREYWDMVRSAFLKYSLQVRMGRMDGIFVAFHNTERIFGFQYISINEMDMALHGTQDRSLGDSEFKLSLHLLNKVLDRATKKFPGRSLRLHIETRPTDPPVMYIFAKPVTPEEIQKVQSSNAAAIADYEKQILGIVKGEAENEVSEPGIEAIDSEFEQLVSHQEDVDGIDEAKYQQRQTQMFWEEMQEKVEEAVEDDALGLGHVREAIQEALEQSGLLKARTSEEARGYVDALLEALTRNQGTEVDSDGNKEDRPAGEDGEEAEVLTLESPEDGNMNTTEETEPSDSDTSQSTHQAAEARPMQDADNTPVDFEKQDSESSSYRDLGLKDLILQAANRADERLESDEFEMHDEDAASDDSKLRAFAGILSELVAKSKQSEDAMVPATSEIEEAAPRASDDADVNLEGATATSESNQDALDENATEKAGDAETELKHDTGELLGMHLTVRNKLNGKDVKRPDPGFNDTSNWEVEYSLEEIPEEKVSRIYEALMLRRKKIFRASTEDKNGQWYKMWRGKLEELSDKGRQHRQEVEKTARTEPVKLAYNDEALTWDEAFKHREQWKPQQWDEPRDSSE